MYAEYWLVNLLKSGEEDIGGENGEVELF